MRRYKWVAGFLFICQLCFAQLSVSPSPGGDNFLYIKGDLLFVTNNLNLQKNQSPTKEASIYLRQGGQLIQGEQQKTSNTGSGSISVFQEGTSNAFDYNYWSPPVVSPQNSYFGISMLYAPFSEIESYPARITAALDGLADPLTISDRWIYIFAGGDYSNWSYVGNSTRIPAGYGFSMKGTQGKDATLIDGRANNPGDSQRYDFRGRPNSGNIEVPITPLGVTLVGNPYASALNLSLFLLENSGSGSIQSQCSDLVQRRNVITGIAYFWDSGDEGNSHYLNDYIGGYGTFSPVDPCTAGIYEKPIFRSGNEHGQGTSLGKHYDRRFTPIAQGFMVQGVNQDVLQFRNAQRIFRKEGNQSHFKTANRSPKSSSFTPLSIPEIQVLVNVNNTYTRGIKLGFWSNSTSGPDMGMDALTYDVAPADVGWLHDGKSYVIDIRPEDLTDEIPLYLAVDGGEKTTFAFSTGEMKNSEIKNLFILDTETKKRHPITGENFEIELEPGDYHGRFKLVFTEDIELFELPEIFLESDEERFAFNIFQNNKTGELEILGTSFSPVKSVAIFDISGKRLLYRTSFGNPRSISISTERWANAVYLVRVTNTNNQSTNKKIIVLNKH